MNLGELIDRMVSAGMTPGDAGDVAAQIYAAGVAAAPIRSRGAERTRRWRANNASQSITERHQTSQCDAAADVETSQSVTERHKASQSVTCDATEGKSVSLSPVPLLSPTPPNNPLTPKPIQNNNSRGHRLPENWRLEGPDLAYSLSKGLTEAETGGLAERFCSWAHSASGPNARKVNWHKAWQGWVQRDGPKIISSRAGSLKPRTISEQKQAATQNVLASLRATNRNGESGGDPLNRVLSLDIGQQPADLRGGLGGDVLDLSRASDRGSG